MNRDAEHAAAHAAASGVRMDDMHGADFAGIEEIKLVEPSDWVSRQANLRRPGGLEERIRDRAQSLELGSHLLLGRGEEQGGGRQRPSILADATESVFAAVYLDGGMDAARDLIHRVLLDKEREEQVEERRRDYKTELQELVQRKSDQILRYELTGSSGPDHAKEFSFRVTLNGAEIGQGTGRSKKEAEQAAARSALAQWKK